MGLPSVVGSAMSTMNDAIWGDPEQFPAVTELDRDHIELAAGNAAHKIKGDGNAYVVLEPHDGTRYEMSIMLRRDTGEFVFSSSMGPMYHWGGHDGTHPAYALEKYVSNGNKWTATVFALFLNSLGAELAVTR